MKISDIFVHFLGSSTESLVLLCSQVKRSTSRFGVSVAIVGENLI